MNVSVLLYAPVLSASLAPIVCLRLIVTTSFDAGAVQLLSSVGAALPPTAANGPPALAISTCGSEWSEQVVTAGANGGRFTATFRITGTTEVVARWAGDSGRQGAGSNVLKVAVRKK